MRTKINASKFIQTKFIHHQIFDIYGIFQITNFITIWHICVTFVSLSVVIHITPFYCYVIIIFFVSSHTFDISVEYSSVMKNIFKDWHSQSSWYPLWNNKNCTNLKWYIVSRIWIKLRRQCRAVTKIWGASVTFWGGINDASNPLMLYTVRL